MKKSKNIRTEQEPEEKANVLTTIIVVGVMLIMILSIGFALLR